MTTTRRHAIFAAALAALACFGEDASESVQPVEEAVPSEQPATAEAYAVPADAPAAAGAPVAEAAPAAAAVPSAVDAAALLEEREAAKEREAYARSEKLRLEAKADAAELRKSISTRTLLLRIVSIILVSWSMSLANALSVISR